MLSLATLFSGALTVLMLRFAFATTTSPASLVPHCRHVFIDLDATSPAALHRLINPTAFPGSPVQATFDECFGRSQEERSRVCMYSLSPSLELAASMEHYRTLGFAIKATHDLADFSKHTRVAGRHIVVQLGRDKSTISAALGLGLLCSADTVISQADESAGAADTLSAELAAAGCSTRVLRIQDDSYREFRLGQALPLSVNPSPPMDTDGRPLRIGLCATLSQSEDPYLMEWVTYYFGLGVEAMLLVDNADEGLPPLAERVPELGRCFGGSIVVVRDVRRFQQFKSYDRCAAAFSAMQDSGSWWVLACDADEYLVLRPNVTIPGFVADVVTRYNEWKKVGAVVANWYIMGSDDHNVTERDAPVTFRFQARQPNANKHVKSIARASSVTGYGSAHNPGLEEGYSSLDSAGRIVKIHLNEQPDAESVAEAWVAHYYTKSLKEYRVSCGLGLLRLPCKQ